MTQLLASRRSLLALGSALAIAAPAAATQPYPTRPVRIIVPVAPGGSLDSLARIVAERLRDGLGQPVLVENRPGAASNLGFELVAGSPPDGDTLLLAPDSLTVNPALFEGLRYNAETSFAPIMLLTRAAQVLALRRDLAATTLQEFIALAMARGGGLNIASPGNASSGHLAGALLQLRTGTTWAHVPYRGGGPAVADVLAGHVDGVWVTLTPAVPHIRAGALRAVAVSTPGRAAALPDVPTVAEQGVPGFDVTNWQGLFAPAGTPPAIIRRLHDALLRVLDEPPVRARLEDQGFEVVAGPPEALAATVAENLPRWREVVRAAGIRAD